MIRASHARQEPRVQRQFVALADLDQALATEVADRYGWERTVCDWTALVESNARLLVNAGPNDLHAEPSVAASKAGMDVFCEKPLAGTADEAYALWRSVAATGVNHRCAFLHRFIPALQLARRLIRDGELGDILHFRSTFLLDMLTGGPLSWRFDRAVAGAGAVGDLGSHHIDVARFLIGEVTAVQATTKTWTSDPAGHVTDVNDDYFSCVASLGNGATAVFEASRIAAGHALTGRIEVDGTAGSLSFDMERLNEIVLRKPRTGATTRLATGAGDPSAGFDLPVGIQGAHPIGWIDCFALQAYDVLALASGGIEESLGATFEDGYRVAEIVDAIERSAATGTRQEVHYRTVDAQIVDV